MIAIAISTVEKVITAMDQTIGKHKTALQKRLRRQKKKLTETRHVQYMDYLLSLKGDIIVAPPVRLNHIKKKLNRIVGPNSLKLPAHQPLRDALFAAFHYQELRSDFYPEYFSKLGIKACIYCNAHLTVTAIETTGHYRAKFQVDHYWAKTDYPAFSTSLFNLYPTCASCNNIKNDKKVSFDLYVNRVPDQSAFSFKLKPGCVKNYLDSRKLSDIEIDFIEPAAPPKHESFDELFAIKGIYDTQKDIAAELIEKAEVYRATYKQGLIKQFPEIFTPASIDRLITGNYTLENEIHKRPMAKFVRDISIQVGLIKK